MQSIQEILAKKNIRSHINEGILICQVDSKTEGFALAKDILQTFVDKATVLYLSGGRTPKELYESFSSQEWLHPGGVGMVDERYGGKFHEKSNEKMLKDTGLLCYLDYNDIPFYPILQPDKNREETAQLYDDKLRSLLSVFQKHIAILGVGLDGHTAGLPASARLWQAGIAEKSKYNLVTDYDDSEGFFKDRITMTFLGLSHMDLLLILVFGEDKQKALEVMFSPGSEKDIPSRFFKRPEIAKKTVLITDQNI